MPGILVTFLLRQKPLVRSSGVVQGLIHPEVLKVENGHILPQRRPNFNCCAHEVDMGGPTTTWFRRQLKVKEGAECINARGRSWTGSPKRYYYWFFLVIVDCQCQRPKHMIYSQTTH
jgi:hypothetical protein